MMMSSYRLTEVGDSHLRYVTVDAAEPLHAAMAVTYDVATQRRGPIDEAPTMLYL